MNATVERSTAPTGERATPWIKWSLAVLALTVVIGLGFSTVYRAAFSRVERTDFTVYRAAGQAVLDGTDIYQAHNVRGWLYVYPPPFAILMVPFARLPVFWGALIWYAISVALTAWAVIMCATLAGRTAATETDRLFLYGTPMLLVLGWFVSGAARGQASILMSWLVIAAFFCRFRERDGLGGVCLAGAILLKVVPAVLLAYFVWRKHWRFVAATFVTLVVGTLLLPAVVFGWQQNVAYLREWVGVVAKPAVAQKETRELSELNQQLLDPQKLRNQSLMAVIGRITQSPRAREAAAVLAVIMAAVMVWSARRAEGDTELLVAAAAIIWMLLVPPVSESHYFVVLLWPLAVLTAEARGGAAADSRRLSGVVLVAFAVVSLVAVCIKSIQFYGPLCWATLGLWATLLTLTVRRSKIDQGNKRGRNTNSTDQR